MSVSSSIAGNHPLSDIMLKGNQDIQMLQQDIASASAFRGMLKGRQVHWKPDAHSLLQDLAEESGMMYGEKLAGRLKRKEDRQTWERIRNKAHFYIEQVPDLGPTTRKLRSFLDDLQYLNKKKSNRKHLSGADQNFDAQDVAAIMKLAKEHFPPIPIAVGTIESEDQVVSAQKDSDQRMLMDPTLKYAALAFARDVMQDKEAISDGAAMAESLQACINQLMESHGEAIRAGINVSATANDFSQTTRREISDLRRFYQEIILPYEDLEKVYQTIAQRIHEISFNEAVDYLVCAAGKDMSSANPSISPALLQNCLSDIRRLQNLTTIYEASAGLMSALQHKFAIASDVKPESLFSRALEFFTQRWTAKSVLGRMCNQLGITQFLPHHFFLTNFMQMVKTAHDRCFAKKDDREIFINAIQDEMDDIIAREESLSPTEWI
jgi:type III secretion system YopN/LcrE/InvE/MxiC family regulator